MHACSRINVVIIRLENEITRTVLLSLSAAAVRTLSFAATPCEGVTRVIRNEKMFQNITPAASSSFTRCQVCSFTQKAKRAVFFADL